MAVIAIATLDAQFQIFETSWLVDHEDYAYSVKKTSSCSQASYVILRPYSAILVNVALAKRYADM